MIIEKHVDIVVGLQFGDEGKGKIAGGIASQVYYDLTARYNGGPNAGHTINLEGGKQLKLHQLPSSIAYKCDGYIGPGTVIDFGELELEIYKFRDVMRFDPLDYLYISPQAIVINKQNVQKDKDFHAGSQGSTSKGIAPTYADFYNRTASLAQDYTLPDSSGEECIESVDVVNNMLLEGAQGFYLNPYQGNYPYTTSSSCHPGAAAATFGFNTSKIRHIIGVAKCYETRSGIDPNFDKVFDQDWNFITPRDNPTTHQWIQDTYEALQEIGNEVGVTTGRKRAVRFLDVGALINAVNSTGTTILVINKWDILDSLPRLKSFPYNGGYSYYHRGHLYRADTNMKQNVESLLRENCPGLQHVIHSSSPTNDINWSKYLD